MRPGIDPANQGVPGLLPGRPGPTLSPGGQWRNFKFPYVRSRYFRDAGHIVRERLVQQCGGRESNPRPVDLKSSAATESHGEHGTACTAVTKQHNLVPAKER